MSSSLVELSKQLLLGVKKGECVLNLRNQLKSFPLEAFTTELTDDSRRIAFWVNCYNAFIQILLEEREDVYHNGKKFYTEKFIPIAGNFLSFDDIEHGILRKRKFKYGLGYLPSFFDGAFVQKHQVDVLDFRIHFALNCGAKSCPPIAFYSAQNLNEELEMATYAFLETNIEFDAQTNTIHVTKLMLWFLGDFGGRNGILNILRQYDLIANDASPKIRFNAYDWTLDKANYQLVVSERKGLE